MRNQLQLSSSLVRRRVTTVTASLVATAMLATSPSMSAGATTTAPTAAWHLVSHLSHTTHWLALAHAGSTWVALGQGSDVATSQTGTLWAHHVAPSGLWRSVAYGDGRFVALSSRDAGLREMISTTGAHWVALPGPTGSWTGITFAQGRFVAVSSGGQLVTSTNGITWSQTWVHSKFHFTSVTYGNGRFIAVDDAQGDALISLNGVGWSFYPIGASGAQWSSVTFGNGNFVAFNATSGDVATSVLGYVWTRRGASLQSHISASSFGCNLFQAVGNGGGSATYSSHLGDTWTRETTPGGTADPWTSTAYGDFRFLALASNGEVASLHVVANCAATVPTSPQQVSGNVHSGQVWTYQHPPMSAGGAPVDQYLVTITDGVTTKHCVAAVYYQPNCVITGLLNHHVYRVSTQAHNRFGYSVPSDPEVVIPVVSGALTATTSTPVVTANDASVQLTGVRANSQGIYPESWVHVRFGSEALSCQPNPFGECLIKVPTPRTGRTSISANYSGYGATYHSGISYVTVATLTAPPRFMITHEHMTVQVRGAVSGSEIHASLGVRGFLARLDAVGDGSIRISSPTTSGTYMFTVSDEGVLLESVDIIVKS